MSDLIKTIRTKLGVDDFVVTQKDDTSPAKLDLKRLKNGQASGFSDEAKVRLLLKAVDTLKEEGLKADLRLSYNKTNESGSTWVPWPHLWVDYKKEEKPKDDPVSRYNRLKKELADAEEALKATTNTTEVSNEPITESDEEAPPF